MNEITMMFVVYLIVLEAFREHLLSAECPTRPGNPEIRGRVLVHIQTGPQTENFYSI